VAFQSGVSESERAQYCDASVALRGKKKNERPQSGYAFRSYTLIDNRYCVPFAFAIPAKDTDALAWKRGTRVVCSGSMCARLARRCAGCQEQ
jgi:hypothetical protein